MRLLVAYVFLFRSVRAAEAGVFHIDMSVDLPFHGTGVTTVFAQAKNVESEEAALTILPAVDLGCRPVGDTSACSWTTRAYSSRLWCVEHCMGRDDSISHLPPAPSVVLVQGGRCGCCDDSALVQQQIPNDADVSCSVYCDDDESQMYVPWWTRRDDAAPRPRPRCGGNSDLYSVFREYDSVVHVGNRNAVAVMYSAKFDIVALEVPWGREFYLYSVHVDFGWPYFDFQTKLDELVTCLHVDETLARVVGLRTADLWWYAGWYTWLPGPSNAVTSGTTALLNNTVDVMLPMQCSYDNGNFIIVDGDSVLQLGFDAQSRLLNDTHDASTIVSLQRCGTELNFLKTTGEDFTLDDVSLPSMRHAHMPLFSNAQDVAAPLAYFSAVFDNAAHVVQRTCVPGQDTALHIWPLTTIVSDDSTVHRRPLFQNVFSRAVISEEFGPTPKLLGVRFSTSGRQLIGTFDRPTLIGLNPYTDDITNFDPTVPAASPWPLIFPVEYLVHPNTLESLHLENITCAWPSVLTFACLLPSDGVVRVKQKFILKSETIFGYSENGDFSLAAAGTVFVLPPADAKAPKISVFTHEPDSCAPLDLDASATLIYSLRATFSWTIDFVNCTRASSDDSFANSSDSFANSSDSFANSSDTFANSSDTFASSDDKSTTTVTSGGARVSLQVPVGCATVASLRVRNQWQLESIWTKVFDFAPYPLPRLRILADEEIIATRAQGLRVMCTVDPSPCIPRSLEQRLAIQWAVTAVWNALGQRMYTDGTLTSTTMNKVPVKATGWESSMFFAPPFSLEMGFTYQLSVTAYYVGALYNKTKTLRVTVVPTPIVVRFAESIANGSEAINVEQSFAPDFPDATVTDFTFACLPLANGTCANWDDDPPVCTYRVDPISNRVFRAIEFVNWTAVGTTICRASADAPNIFISDALDKIRILATGTFPYRYPTSANTTPPLLITGTHFCDVQRSSGGRLRQLESSSSSARPRLGYDTTSNWRLQPNMVTNQTRTADQDDDEDNGRLNDSNARMEDWVSLLGQDNVDGRRLNDSIARMKDWVSLLGQDDEDDGRLNDGIARMKDWVSLLGQVDVDDKRLNDSNARKKDGVSLLGQDDVDDRRLSDSKARMKVWVTSFSRDNILESERVRLYGHVVVDAVTDTTVSTVDVSNETWAYQWLAYRLELNPKYDLRQAALYGDAYRSSIVEYIYRPVPQSQLNLSEFSTPILGERTRGIVLPPYSLKPNFRYRFVLTVTNNTHAHAAASGSKEVFVQHGDPYAGEFRVTPTSGTAGTTVFHLECDGFAADEAALPLLYDFGYSPDWLSNSPMEIRLRGVGKTVLPSLSVSDVSAGQNNSVVEFFVDVYTTLGGFVRVKQFVTVYSAGTSSGSGNTSTTSRGSDDLERALRIIQAGDPLAISSALPALLDASRPAPISPHLHHLVQSLLDLAASTLVKFAGLAPSEALSGPMISLLSAFRVVCVYIGDVNCDFRTILHTIVHASVGPFSNKHPKPLLTPDTPLVSYIAHAAGMLQPDDTTVGVHRWYNADRRSRRLHDLEIPSAGSKFADLSVFDPVFFHLVPQLCPGEALRFDVHGATLHLGVTPNGTTTHPLAGVRNVSMHDALPPLAVHIPPTLHIAPYGWMFALLKENVFYFPSDTAPDTPVDVTLLQNLPGYEHPWYRVSRVVLCDLLGTGLAVPTIQLGSEADAQCVYWAKNDRWSARNVTLDGESCQFADLDPRGAPMILGQFSTLPAMETLNSWSEVLPPTFSGPGSLPVIIASASMMSLFLISAAISMIARQAAGKSPHPHHRVKKYVVSVGYAVARVVRDPLDYAVEAGGHHRFWVSWWNVGMQRHLFLGIVTGTDKKMRLRYKLFIMLQITCGVCGALGVLRRLRFTWFWAVMLNAIVNWPCGVFFLTLYARRLCLPRPLTGKRRSTDGDNVRQAALHKLKAERRALDDTQENWFAKRRTKESATSMLSGLIDKQALSIPDDGGVGVKSVLEEDFVTPRSHDSLPAAGDEESSVASSRAVPGPRRTDKPPPIELPPRPPVAAWGEPNAPQGRSPRSAVSRHDLSSTPRSISSDETLGEEWARQGLPPAPREQVERPHTSNLNTAQPRFLTNRAPAPPVSHLLPDIPKMPPLLALASQVRPFKAPRPKLPPPLLNLGDIDHAGSSHKSPLEYVSRASSSPKAGYMDPRYNHNHEKPSLLPPGLTELPDLPTMPLTRLINGKPSVNVDVMTDKTQHEAPSPPLIPPPPPRCASAPLIHRRRVISPPPPFSLMPQHEGRDMLVGPGTNSLLQPPTIMPLVPAALTTKPLRPPGAGLVDVADHTVHLMTPSWRQSARGLKDATMHHRTHLHDSDTANASHAGNDGTAVPKTEDIARGSHKSVSDAAESGHLASPCNDGRVVEGDCRSRRGSGRHATTIDGAQSEASSTVDGKSGEEERKLPGWTKTVVRSQGTEQRLLHLGPVSVAPVDHLPLPTDLDSAKNINELLNIRSAFTNTFVEDAKYESHSLDTIKATLERFQVAHTNTLKQDYVEVSRDHLNGWVYKVNALLVHCAVGIFVWPMCTILYEYRALLFAAQKDFLMFFVAAMCAVLLIAGFDWGRMALMTLNDLVRMENRRIKTQAEWTAKHKSRYLKAAKKNQKNASGDVTTKNPRSQNEKSGAPKRKNIEGGSDLFTPVVFNNSNRASALVEDDAWSGSTMQSVARGKLSRVMPSRTGAKSDAVGPARIAWQHEGTGAFLTGF